MPASHPLPTVIGPTENALRALLEKLLSTTLIKTYPAWVALNAASKVGAASSAGDWRIAVADALKVARGDLDAVLDQLRVTGLIDDEDALTALGTAQLATGRSAVFAATSRLTEGLSEEAQATTQIVLNHVRRKAEELLRH